MKRFRLKLLLFCALTLIFGAVDGTVGVSLASPDQSESSGYFRIGYSRVGSCHLIPDRDHVVVDLNCTDDILEGYSCAPAGARVVEVRYSVLIESHPLEQISCNDYEIYLSSDNHGGATKYLLVYDNLGSMRDGGHDDDPENDYDIYLEWRSTHAFDGENPNQNWYLWVEDTQGWNRGCLASVDFEIHWVAGPPPNDDCSKASPVGDVTNLPFNTIEATFDGPGLCMTSPNIWYCYTASCTGKATVSLCGSSYNTMLAVYNGCNCNPTITRLIECNDDYCGQQSQITFDVTAGNQYLIEIGGNGNKTGQGVLNISCELPPPPPPPNDDCSEATPVGDVTNLPFDTTEATFDGPGHCMTSPNIWFCYTASCTGIATVSLCGSDYDTKLAIYQGCGCYPSAIDLLRCNDDYRPDCGPDSQVSFGVVTGQQYLIEVGGCHGDPRCGEATGEGVLTITCEPAFCPPSNDDYSNAATIGDVWHLPFDTRCATFDGPGSCPADGKTGPNIWYRYTATCTGPVTVSLLGSEFDTYLAVYSTMGHLISCNDDYNWPYVLQSQLTFNAVAGQQYRIEVGGYKDVSGEGVLTIACEGAPPESNDDCSNAKPIGDVKDLPFDTTEATFDGPGLCMTSPNLWYCYTATCTGDVTVSLCGSSFDTQLAVYKGCNCYLTDGDLIGCNDDYCEQQSQITFAAIAGNQYLIEVGGYGNKTGQGVLSISCEEVITADLDFGDAPDSTNNFSRAMTAYTLGWYTTIRANFPTVFNDGSTTGPYGPLHRHPLTVAYLGESVSLEVEADIGTDMDGLNNINPPSNAADKDGADDSIILPIILPHCDWATFDYLVNVINPGTDLWVNVWFDWNRDGDWDDNTSTDQTLNCPKGLVSEWVVKNQLLFSLPAGIHQITTPAFLAFHPQDGPTKVWMRITLSEKLWKGGETPGKLGNGGSGPQAGYDFGETEDYIITPIIPEPGDCTLCQDLNGDGKIDNQDLIMLVDQWLAKCI